MTYIVPDGPPNDLEVVSTNLTAINISWGPVNCTQQNSIIKGYIIHYWKTSEDKATNKSRDTVEPDDMIVKLDPNTEYVLEVRAVNDKNMTGPSADLTVNTSIPKGREISFIRLLITLYY